MGSVLFIIYGVHTNYRAEELLVIHSGSIIAKAPTAEVQIAYQDFLLVLELGKGTKSSGRAEHTILLVY